MRARWRREIDQAEASSAKADRGSHPRDCAICRQWVKDHPEGPNVRISNPFQDDDTVTGLLEYQLLKTLRLMRCDVCLKPTATLVVCDPQYFRSFRCEEHIPTDPPAAA